MCKTIAGMLGQSTGHVHLAGICGVGMAGLALLLRKRGFRVTGCDLQSGALGNWLQAEGIEVRAGHSADHITRDVAWVIRSRAVPDACPDIAQALELDVPVFFRGEVLPALLGDSTSIAVSGTHGKTTTAVFIAQILRAAGCDPSWCIGGAAPAMGGVAGVGKGGLLVVETDESDGTAALYHPDITVITNIEFDHMEHFKDVPAFEACFVSLAGQTKRRVVYCADDPRAAALGGRVAGALAYGIGAGAALRADKIRADGDGQLFEPLLSGRTLGTWRLPLPGRHNVLNALAATAVCLELGLDAAVVSEAVAALQLPARRLERIPAPSRVSVMSDYAHHPTEIAATLAAVRGQTPRLEAIFQPHRYTRTRALRQDFPAAFQGLARLVLVPVYAASEAPLAGGSIWDLYAEIKQSAAAQSGDYPEVVAAVSLQQAWEYLRHELQERAALLIIGAGDVEQVAGWAREAGRLPFEAAPDFPLRPQLELGSLKARLRETTLTLDEPIGRTTTLGVGGTADLVGRVGSVADLAALLEWAAARAWLWRVLGGGSNVLVSDCGLRGVTLLLRGPTFEAIREEDGRVMAGAGAPLARLTAWLTSNGHTGLEFMDGIPGSVGGALCMNAGTGGRGIAERATVVHGLNPDGSPFRLCGAELGAGYRSCTGLEGRIVTEVVFALDRATSATVQERRSFVAARRRRWKGRSAGSVFKNPTGDFAGRLIEAAGFKGLRVGGAFVSDEHANVIIAGDRACASDVKALMELVRAGVQDRSGIRLENELVEFA